MKNTYLLIAVIILMPVSWFVLLKLFSRYSGWNKLSTAYPFIDDTQSRKFHFQTIRFGSSNLPVTVGVNEQYLTLNMFFLFKFGPAVTIPLQDISGRETYGFFHNFVELSFKNAPDIRFSITYYLAEKIESVSGNKWKYIREQKT